MRYGHPQKAQIVGCVPIGIGLVAAGLAGEDLAPPRAKAAAARARLARVVRPCELNEDTGDPCLVRDELPELVEAPAQMVVADSLRHGRSGADAGQVFEAEPRVHLNRLLHDAFRDGVVLGRLEASLPARQPVQDRAASSPRGPCAFAWRERRTR